MNQIKRAAAWMAFAFAMCISPAYAADEYNADPTGVAIDGYDPVAYFVVDRPVKGEKAISTVHDGATYLFSTAENKKVFDAAPAKYAPAYGGWCSYGVRVGKKFKADPTAFVIDNDRLFLQLDLGTQKVWISELNKNIEIADRLWPKLKNIGAAELGK